MALLDGLFDHPAGESGASCTDSLLPNTRLIQVFVNNPLGDILEAIRRTETFEMDISFPGEVVATHFIESLTRSSRHSSNSLFMSLSDRLHSGHSSGTLLIINPIMHALS